MIVNTTAPSSAVRQPPSSQPISATARMKLVQGAERKKVFVGFSTLPMTVPRMALSWVS